MKTITLIGLILISAQVVLATHIVGGYIQVKPISNTSFTYQITTVVYMHAGTSTDQTSTITVCLGDGNSLTAARTNQQYLPSDKTITLNTYQSTYTYPGPGAYTVTASLAGRTASKNVSIDNQSFILTNAFIINAAIINQTPTLALPASTFTVGVGQRVSLLFKATDAESDSLVYGLGRPLSSNNSTTCGYQSISTYQFPNDLTRKGTFKLNNRTGELVWDAPTESGNYSVAVTVSEYRKGVLISQTLQEITLMVSDLPGTPSSIPNYEPAHEEGNIVTETVFYSDPDIAFATFPNPVDDRLQVVIQTSNPTTATIQLTDSKGRTLHELGFTKPSRQHEQLIGMGSLTPGIYLIRADVNGRSFLRKVVKK